MPKNNSLISKLFIVLLLSIVAGCATSPQKLGISEKDWQSYDEAKQKELLASYKQISATNAQEDAITNEKYLSNDADSSDHYLTINVHGGETLMPPFTGWQRYKSTSFNLYPNSCTNAFLEQRESGKDSGKNGVFLRTCYKDNILLIDPSLYEADKKDGTLRITYSPLWEQGFSYRGIYTDGYVKLKNATFDIKNRH
jgi:hypothetical protein